MLEPFLSRLSRLSRPSRIQFTFRPLSTLTSSVPPLLLGLSCSSLLVSLILLIVSLLDLGYLSLFLNPCLSLFTIAYHIIVFILATTPRHGHNSESDAPPYFATTVVSAYMLSILWIIASVCTISLFASRPGDYTAYTLHLRGLPVTLTTQAVECVLTVLQSALVGAFAIRGHFIAREGVPEGWRRIIPDDKHAQGTETHSRIAYDL